MTDKATSELCVDRLNELGAILEQPGEHSLHLWLEFALHNLSDQLDSLNLRMVNLNTEAQALCQAIEALAHAVDHTHRALFEANELLNHKAVI